MVQIHVTVPKKLRATFFGNHKYVHGIVIKCCDGVLRRFYPRLFTYSADYPEKYVACISVVDFSMLTK